MRPAGAWLARSSICGLASSALAACFRIDPHRSQQAAKELLGESFGGFVVSDRYTGYHFLDALQQQLCWAHVIRQLVEVSERQGTPGKLGKKLLKAASEVIKIHRRYLEHGHDLDWLRDQLSPLREGLYTPFGIIGGAIFKLVWKVTTDQEGGPCSSPRDRSPHRRKPAPLLPEPRASDPVASGGAAPAGTASTRDTRSAQPLLKDARGPRDQPGRALPGCSRVAAVCPARAPAHE